MKQDRIVLVSNQDDIHTDDVVRAIQRLDEEPIRLNTDEIPLETLISFEFDGSWSGQLDLLTNSRVIDVQQIKSVWWRRPSAFRLPDYFDDWERELGQARVTQTLRGLWANLDCYWMSHPDAVDSAVWKVEQLRRAVTFGFDIPRTLVTSDPDEARAFHRECGGQMVWKPLSGPYLAAHRYSYHHPQARPPQYLTNRTTLIGTAELDHLDGIRLVPSMFQELVPKRLEYRVTIIGDSVFTAEISSQDSEDSLVDSRGSLEVPYRPVTLPDALQQRCLDYVASYDLQFSAIDLVLTPDDRYVFLENNPVGQFGYVEELVPELELNDALATCLIRAGR